MPPNVPRYIFLSPHLDDAVLSCGGMIYQLVQAGHPVQVITIFAGDPPRGPLSPFAQSLHERWRTDPAGRRREDIEALRLLGAEAIHWPYPDAIYRRDAKTGAALYDSEASIFGEVQAGDSMTPESLAQDLASLALLARLIAPLAAGHHVDHQIVRAAAESLGRALTYYEDYPYVETPEKLEDVLGAGHWGSEIAALNDDAIRVKSAAIRAYRSQRSSFFKSDEEIERRIRAYANLAGGKRGPTERLWRVGEGRFEGGLEPAG